MDFFGAKNVNREQQGDKAEQGDDGSEPTTSISDDGSIYLYILMMEVSLEKWKLSGNLTLTGP